MEDDGKTRPPPPGAAPGTPPERSPERCLACGYDLKGLDPDHCPECGVSRQQLETWLEARARAEASIPTISAWYTLAAVVLPPAYGVLMAVAGEEFFLLPVFWFALVIGILLGALSGRVLIRFFGKVHRTCVRVAWDRRIMLLQFPWLVSPAFWVIGWLEENTGSEWYPAIGFIGWAVGLIVLWSLAIHRVLRDLRDLGVPLTRTNREGVAIALAIAVVCIAFPSFLMCGLFYASGSESFFG